MPLASRDPQPLSPGSSSTLRQDTRISVVPDTGLSTVCSELGCTPPVSSPAEARDRVLAVCSRSPTVCIPVTKCDMEGAERQEPASNLVSTQAPGQVRALAHSPPFTRVVGLPQSNNAPHDIIF